MNKLGEMVYNYRMKNKLSQTEFGEKVKIKVSMVSQIESGLKIPSVGTLVDIADVLEVSVDELLGRAEKKGVSE